jgi:hypothetical protein
MSGSPTSELHRPVMVGRIGPSGLSVAVEADEAERAALAARMGLPAIASLTCRFALTRRGQDRIDAVGRLNAQVTQVCVVSLEEFSAEVAEEFTVRFVPEGTESDDPDPDSVDEIPYAGDTIDLGEAAAEQLALALDPYPRRPGAVLPDLETEVDPRLAALTRWQGGEH